FRRSIMSTLTRYPTRKLAILGGAPAFNEPLHVGRPNIVNRDRFQKRLDDLLDRNWLTNRGPYVREFEQRIAEYLGVKHCIAVCNATVGLELAARAIGVHGEVIVPSFTFIATAHALQWQEITPVFADISADSHTLDPSRLERHITPRTTGILATHLWGRACDIDALQEIANRRGLALFFDAAHAFGGTYRGRRIGNFGAAEVFSFHATKFLNSFEGGAITTNDDALAEKIRLMTNFGFSGYDNVIYVGTNGKMTEVSAAMGLSNLERIDELVAVNRTNLEEYGRGLDGLPGLRLLRPPESEQANCQYVVLEIDETCSPLHRDQLVTILHAENVLARKYFWPGCHNMEPYRSYYPHAGLLLPETNRVARRVVVLPTGYTIGAEAIRLICGIIHDALNHATECSGQPNRPPVAA
ncbi:MAG TPA: DegT/DnrJ/EryC1/StrS family aminotransferase, partial [Candidatus Synoicihabitans sp.]|nr:DegT/DnrJ/EryC1/StrS family aminotransferase [Candidatus Synoicihabitans sp.]